MTPWKKRSALIFALTSIIVPGNLFADDSPVRIRGFFSTGITGTTRRDADVANPRIRDSADAVSSNTRYHRAPEIERNTLIGLNFSGDAGEDWSFAGQLLADGGAPDYSLVSMDWAFLTYRPTDSISIRFGRQKTPVWMISDYSDVRKDHLWANPPVEIYSLFPVKVLDGVGATFSTKIAGLGLSLDPFIGTVNLKRDYPAPSTVTAPRLYGAALTADFEWIKIRAAYTKSIWNVGVPPVSWNERKLDFISLGIQGDKSNVVFASEYTSMKDLNKSEFEDLTNSTQTSIDSLNKLAKIPQSSRAAAGSNMSDGEIATSLSNLAVIRDFYAAKFDGMRGYYATLGYRVTDNFLPTFTYASASSDESQIYYYMNQKTTQVDLSYDASIRTNVKLQGRQVAVFTNKRSEFSTSEGADTRVYTYAATLNTTF